jgi:hypothetical protein
MKNKGKREKKKLVKHLELLLLLLLLLDIFFIIYCKNVLNVDCQTQGRIKRMIELYFNEKSVINSKYEYLISVPSYFSW